MEWCDEGIILTVRKYGENSHIVTIFTATKGKYSGLIKGKPKENILQTGNLVKVRWRSRIEHNLGYFNLELLSSFAAKYLHDFLRLLSISSACALIEKTLPERENSQNLYQYFKKMLNDLADDHWAENYVKWEVFLLSTLGYGLNLSACVVTGEQDNLIYVSPKSGCAVSEKAGSLYHNKLLSLPSFLVKNKLNNISFQDIAEGLKLTEYFLKRHIFNGSNIEIPFARKHLAGFFIGKSDD